jgi:hypothetical protein
MTESNQNTIITFKIPPSTKVTYIATLNGEIGYIKLTENKLYLLRGRVYKIPVNTLLKLDDFYMIKIKGLLKELIDVRNIENGIATVVPIIHNVVIKDNMELGQFV